MDKPGLQICSSNVDCSQLPLDSHNGSLDQGCPHQDIWIEPAAADGQIVVLTGKMMSRWGMILTLSLQTIDAIGKKVVPGYKFVAHGE